MIIPVRCFTCGKVLANKWKAYCERAERLDKTATSDADGDSRDFFFEEVPKGKLLDDLGIERMCCRRHMLSHVDLIDII